MKTPKLVETSLGASSHVGCSSSPLSSPSHVTVLPFASRQAPVHPRSHIGVRSVDAGFSRRHASAGDWPTQIEGNHDSNDSNRPETSLTARRRRRMARKRDSRRVPDGRGKGIAKSGSRRWRAARGRPRVTAVRMEC